MEPVLVIVGPTAAGKSDLGLALAEELGGEIVNADALQVYRGFDVGTAKPTVEEQRRVPHHLVDILAPEERYSAGEFARRARTAVEEIAARGRRSIVVGGSGLYVRALVEGISPIPPGDPAIRRYLRQRLEEAGLEPLREELRLLDQPAWERLPAADKQRVLRALEVALVTGRRLTDWIADRPFGERRLDAVKVGLTLPRALLYDRIEGRVRRMVAFGWVEEVRKHLASGVSLEAPAFQAIGYRQLARHLEGEITLEDAVVEIVQATRRFAKRQMTWFRREPEVHWVDSESLRGRVSDVMKIPCIKGLGGSNAEAQH
jgi:tRNA dimethylallyltransferase